MLTLLVRILGIVIVLTTVSCTSQYIFITPLSAKSRDKEIKLNFYVGDFGIGKQSGNSRWRRGYPDHQTLEQDGLVAWWSLKTDSGYKYYYARSKNNEKLSVPRHYGGSKKKYRLKVSFGPMYLYETGISEKQKQTATLLNKSSRGRNLYLWGNNNELYYTVEKDGVNVQEAAREPGNEWRVISSIELTKNQYQYLDARCSSSWRHVRCFIDEKFPALTPKQFKYIKARKRKNDEKRLDGTINPPPPSEPNRWA
jgi:hypothetical protein